MYEENELYAKHPTGVNGIVKEASKMNNPDENKVSSENGVSKEVEMTIMNGNDEKYAIRMTNVYAKWSEKSGDDSLSNVNINVEKGRLLAIIGPVGAGKVRYVKFITLS